MHSNEVIIIYLAAAAPFGVASYLREPRYGEFPRTLLQASGAALLWPLTLLMRLRFRRKVRGGQSSPTPTTSDISPSCVTSIIEARRALLSALYLTEDCAQQTDGLPVEAAVRAVRECVAGVERYAELTRAVAEISDEQTAVVSGDSASFPRSLELCRIAGREDDDLLIAGRCLQRRHAARLREHQTEARRQLLQTLAALRERFSLEPAVQIVERQAARPLHEALLETYARAIDLFAQFADEPAVSRVALLFDTTHASVSRYEPFQTLDAPEPFTAPNIKVAGDEQCPTSTPNPNPKRQLVAMPTLKAHG